MNGQGLRLHGLQIHTGLWLTNGGRGLYGHLKHQGSTGGHTAQHAAVIIGQQRHLSVPNGVAVVHICTKGAGKIKAQAKLHALHRRNAKQQGRELALHGREHIAPYPHRQTDGRALNAAAHTVLLQPGSLDHCAHIFLRFRVQHGKRAVAQAV